MYIYIYIYTHSVYAFAKSCHWHTCGTWKATRVSHHRQHEKIQSPKQLNVSWCLLYQLHSAPAVLFAGWPLELPRDFPSSDGNWRNWDDRPVLKHGSEWWRIYTPRTAQEPNTRFQFWLLLLKETSSKLHAVLHHASMKNMWSHHCIHVLVVLNHIGIYVHRIARK